MDIGQKKSIIMDAVRDAAFGNTHPLDNIAFILEDYEKLTGKKIQLDHMDKFKLDWEKSSDDDV